MRRILGAALAVLLPCAPAAARIVDRIAAVVNTDVITLSEVDEAVQRRPGLAEALRDPEEGPKLLSKARSQALEQLIAERLLEAEIRKRELRATELQIERAFELQIRANNTTRERFVEELKKSGYTLASYKEELARRLQRQMLLERLFMPNIKISDEDVKNYYTQNVNAIRDESMEVCVSHILFHTPAGMAPAAQEAQKHKAEDVLLKVKSGGDFSELAKQHSQDPSAARGGDLGCFRKGVMVAEFEKAVFALKKGEVSGIVKTPFGYHIAKVNDIRGSSVRPFNEVKEQIRMKLSQDAMERQVMRWVEEQKKKSFVDKKL